MRIKIAKLYISPVVFHGYVEIKKESLLEMEKHELVIFFLSGAVGNVFLIGVSLLLVSNFINFYFSIVNICYATASVLPFIIGNNDMRMVYCTPLCKCSLPILSIVYHYRKR